jgi:hypothetical protein
MIRIVIDKTQIKTDAEKAAFNIVKATLEKTLKTIEPDVKKEGGSVEIRVTGPGTYEIEMEGLSPRLRKKVSRLIKTQSK